MIPRPEYEDLLRRRRIWGVPPDAVEELAAQCARTQADLRTRLAAMEEQLVAARAERDALQQTVARLREDATRLEQEKQEIANRPEAVREEAVRFVVDAWIEAQAIRDQTQRDIQASQEAARQEIAAIRQQATEERQRHEATLREERERHEADMRMARQQYEAEITALHERRQRAVAALEALAENLLHQAGHDNAAPVASPETPPAATASPIPSAAFEADTLESLAPAEEHPAPAPHPETTIHDGQNGNHATMNGSSEDELLVKALDELEAILSAPRKQ